MSEIDLNQSETLEITELDGPPAQTEQTEAVETEQTEQQSEQGEAEADIQPPETSSDEGTRYQQGNLDASQDEQEVEQEEAEADTTEDQAEESTDIEEEEQEDYFTFDESLSQATNGLVRNEAQLETIIRENEAFKANKPQELEGGAKSLYDFASKFQGNEMGGARKMLHALSLDTDKLSPKDLMFESFMLDEKNSDLTRERAHELFDEHYSNKYSDAAENILSARDLELATRDAVSSIKSVQQEYADAQSEMPEAQNNQAMEDAKIEIGENVDKVMNEYDGVDFPMDESGENNIAFSVDTDDMRDELAFAQKNTGDWLQSKIDGYTNEDGSFNYADYNTFMTAVVFHEKIAQTMYHQGIASGKESVLAELKNPPNKATPGNASENDQKSTSDKVDDAWANAMQNF